MAVYWSDSREQHGSGRRYLQPRGELSGGLGGFYGTDTPATASAPSRKISSGGRRTSYNGYGGAEPVGSVAGLFQEAAAPAPAVEEALVADPYAPAASLVPPRSEAAAFARKPSGMSESVSNGAGGVPHQERPFEVMEPPLAAVDEQAAYDAYAASPAMAGSDDAFMAGGRRHFERQDHMQDAGTSAPDLGRHGRGRRYIEAADHEVIRQDLGQDAAGQPLPPDFSKPTGRRYIPVADGIKTQMRTPLQESEYQKPPSNVDMKDSVKEWITTVHNMVLADEDRWEREVELKPRGCQWVLEAHCPRRKTITREGPTARAIAEKLSMMPVAELRHFGLRFAGIGDEYRKEPVRRSKQAPAENNPTMVSFGVHDAFGREDRAPQGGEISNVRAHPDHALQRRYIASGKDNFAAQAQPSGDSPGHIRDTDFANGIERGIGAGKRHHIGMKDSIRGVLYGQ
eukprot:TRINITY_DN17346_c0_g1_i1.p1 TRINITY_DN17346_c0_g1~~TRINITY_DN17346_c0_g1_i1.p1  ORF type:complete len:456 (-),score=92.52 TRINITY_DN17346_c0_g1_i1:101-1468(-)